VLLTPKFEKKIHENVLKFGHNEVLEILEHFSNQGEGGDGFYDNFEKLLTPGIHTMEATDLAVIFLFLYSTKRKQ
jgi:hypothetical protein